MRPIARYTRRVIVLLMFVVCVWGVAAKAAPPQAHDIAISGFAYHPNPLTVHVGDTVTWKNNDIVPHTVTAVDKSFDSGAIKPGKTWTFVAKKAGSFAYVCSPHPNMHGTLIVQ